MILKRILYLAEVDEQGHSDAEWTDNLETHKRFNFKLLGKLFRDYKIPSTLFGCCGYDQRRNAKRKLRGVSQTQ